MTVRVTFSGIFVGKDCLLYIQLYFTFDCSALLFGYHVFPRSKVDELSMHLQHNASYRESSFLTLRQSSTDNLNLFQCRFPRFPHMRDFNQRIATFQNWPYHVDYQPADFADAGFFYLGVGDRVKCFYCNGGLQHWENDQEPWSEHAKWFPNCEYLLRHRGVAFVEDIADRYPDLQRPVVPHQQTNQNQVETTRENTSIASSRLSLFVLPTKNLNNQQQVNADTSNRCLAGSSNSNKTIDEKVSDAMASSLVQNAIQLCFEPDLVRKVVTRKIINDNSQYTSLLQLVEDLQNETKKTANDPKKPVSNFPCNVESPQTSKLPAQSLQLPSNNNENSKENDRRKQELIDQRTCKVCLDRFYDCMFMPCNHLCCCLQCASALKQCPLCRRKVDKIIKVYRE